MYLYFEWNIKAALPEEACKHNERKSTQHIIQWLKRYQL